MLKFRKLDTNSLSLKPHLSPGFTSQDQRWAFQGEERSSPPQSQSQAPFRKRWSMDWTRIQVRKQNSYLVTRDLGKWSEPCVLHMASQLTFAFSHPMVMVQNVKLLLGGGSSTHLWEFANWVDELEESVATPVSCAFCEPCTKLCAPMGTLLEVFAMQLLRRFPVEKSGGV